ncbi:hypothetical protein [Halobellus salinisoli]|uniref:hypothetical protein n=1 Tax=Halobellus salinisoli TaxID=3108500 RepID=UPI003009D91E
MRRRRFLSTLPAVSLAPLTGCLSLSSTSETTDSPTPSPLPESGDGALSEFDAGDPFETRRVGQASASTSHRAVVWNDDSDRRAVSIRLSRVDIDAEPDTNTVVEESPTFPAYGVFRIDVFRPSDYVLAVDPPTAERRRLGIREDFVDCNESATHVAVRPDGSVRARVVSTAVACADEYSATATETDAAQTSHGTGTADAVSESRTESATLR